MQISAEIGEKMTPPSALVMTSRLIINDWEFVEINLFRSFPFLLNEKRFLITNR